MKLTQRAWRKTVPLCGIVVVLAASTACRSGQGQGLYAISIPLAASANDADEQKQLIALVQDFLANVPAGKRETFDRFYADDVIYTRASGQLITKQDILAHTKDSSVVNSKISYSGDEFNVHLYGNIAVVNFRMTMHDASGDKAVTKTFRNTGTFMNRNGQWQAIAWQATPIS
jgi:ketosteroid isomerase-like protein